MPGCRIARPADPQGGNPVNHTHISPSAATYRQKILRALAVFVGFLLLYALLPSRNPNYADDSLDWAEQLTRTQGLINSHHLALNFWRVAWHGLHDGLGLTIGSGQLLSLWSAICGAAGLAALWLMLRRTFPPTLALAGVLTCGFSAGYWSYSIVGDVYIPAIAFLTIGTERFLAALHSPGRARSMRAALMSGLALYVSVMHHQAHAVYVAMLAPASLLLRGIPWNRRLTVACSVPLLAGMLSLATYMGVYAARDKAPGESFGGFVAGYAGHFETRADQKALGAKALVNAAAGQARALITYNVVFRSTQATQAIQARFPYRNVYSYPYLVRNLSVPSAVAIGLASALAGFLIVGFVIIGVVLAIRERDSALLLLLVALPQAIFFMWWEGISDEFWLWTIPTLAVVAVTGTRVLGRHAATAMGAIATLLLLSTSLGSVRLYLDAGNDIDSVNDAYMKDLAPDDLLISWDGIQSTGRVNLLRPSDTFGYFNIQARAGHWSSADSLEMEQAISSNRSRNGRIWLGPYLHDMPASNMQFILAQNPAFERTYPALLARLDRLDSTSVVRCLPVARVPALFQRF